jgi:hypothetical protein
MRFLKWFGIFLLVLIIIYFLGPQPPTPKYNNELPAVPSNAIQLEKYIADNEAKHKLKTDNEARIIWYNDSTKEKQNMQLFICMVSAPHRRRQSCSC